jgi:hypothetical protein
MKGNASCAKEAGLFKEGLVLFFVEPILLGVDI